MQPFFSTQKFSDENSTAEEIILCRMRNVHWMNVSFCTGDEVLSREHNELYQGKEKVLLIFTSMLGA